MLFVLNRICFYVFCCFIIVVNGKNIKHEGKESGNVEDDCNLPSDVIQDIAAYAEAVDGIIDYITKGPYKGQAWKSLAAFVDQFGSRIVGTQNLENAIDYVVDLLKENNLENVHTEDVQVPFWSRGEEHATLMEPRVKNLPILGLGTSVATPPEGITAETVVVRSFDELHNLTDDFVRDKIVLYDEPFITYDQAVAYRSQGASEASKKGAVAALVRSLTPFSLDTPHAGVQFYEDNVTQIPVAAITIEDADQLTRMYDNNTKIVIKLLMSATQVNKTSRNTIAEVTGTEMKDKVVVVSGHLDSWDVGEGAMDDGGGAFISWIAPAVLNKMAMRPRRTLRTILWTAEEFRVIGSEAYTTAHESENANLNFVMESDIGTFSPLGLTYAGSKTGECMMREILKLFTAINTTQLELGDPGPDLTFWVDKGIPAGGLMNANDKYFWYHHSAGDTMNVIDPEALDRCAAFWTAFSYVVADLNHDIPRN